MEINDVVIFPNPFRPSGSDCSIRFDITEHADMITVRIYTVGFRKVLEKPIPGDYFRQSTVKLNSWHMGNMAKGIYYVVISAGGNGEKAVSKPEELILIK